MDENNLRSCLLRENDFKNHTNTLSKSALQLHKLSLQSSSNTTSNILLSDVWNKNMELCTNDAVDNILGSAQDFDTSGAKTWESSLSVLDPRAIFEKAIPPCTKCSVKPPSNTFSKLLANHCKCDIPIIKTDKSKKLEKSFISTLSSEGSSQESCEQRFKPRFGRQRKQAKNQDIASKVQTIDFSVHKHDDKSHKATSKDSYKFGFNEIERKVNKSSAYCYEEDIIDDKVNKKLGKYSHKSSYKFFDDYTEERVRKPCIEDEIGPSNKPMTLEEEEKAHKSNVAKITFRTAKETFLANNPAAKRTLGASRKAQAKFVSPMIGAQDKQETSDPEITDERLKHIDPKMVELIESEIIDKGTPIGWDDIAGLHMAKSVIQEAVVWPLLRPDIFTGLRRPPKGILLFGPPGTGKTLIGKCIASQCNATFFSISASSLTSKWIGDGEKMVRALFAVATCHQPAVIFIDEIDSLLTQRSDSEHEATRRIKTEFLVQFDGAATGDEDRILIVGATNRPQELDEAARRRLVKRLYIPLPDVNARQQIITNLLKTENNDLNPSQILEIANLTEGYSGADMKSLCSEAAMGPIRSVPLSQIVTIDRHKVRSVCYQDFITALQRVKPSVSQDDLGQYVKWNKTYGQGF